MSLIAKQAPVLAAIALIGLAFHFWPWPDSSLWKLLAPANLSILFWTAMMPICCLFMTNDNRRKFSLPHISVLALITIHILSLAVTPDLSRSLIFTFKLALIYLGGYSLFRFSLTNGANPNIYYQCSISVAISLLAVWVFPLLNLSATGFHHSIFKYATFQSILLPLTATYLILDQKLSRKIASILLVILAGLTTTTLGMLLPIAFAFLVSALLNRKTASRCFLLLVLFLSAVSTKTIFIHPQSATLLADASLYESDGQNIRQRYLQWQALLNLLEDRPVTGSGAGCVNEYRSEYYYRLPKLNTIEPFDQNGYLALAAECGILGLVCFVWLLVHYFSQTVSQIKGSLTSEHLRCALANSAGLIGAAIAHLFSSVQYNGILLAFVLVLVLIDHNANHRRKGLS